MKYKLSDICESAKGKIKVSALDESTYISTENMLPNKGGITKAESLPTQEQTQAFMKNDVLVSNIRPYFKKIWYATFDGGCSNDVLVFRAKDGVSSRFLHYVLADDNFFDYSMATSKGTKMPRGDKKAIMEYEVPELSYEEQCKIASILEVIDDKIELNNRINDNLLQQAFTLFDSQFSDITTGSCLISDYILPKRGRGLLSKDAIKGDVPVVAGGLEPATYHNVANTTSPVLTISASGANAGFIRLWNIPVWSSDSSFIDSSISEFVYVWFVLLKKRQDEIYGSQTGSAQPHIYPQNIGALPICELDKNEVKRYNDLVTPLFGEIGANELENKSLANLRDTLLPKLMAGEIDLDSLDA